MNRNDNQRLWLNYTCRYRTIILKYFSNRSINLSCYLVPYADVTGSCSLSICILAVTRKMFLVKDYLTSASRFWKSFKMAIGNKFLVALYVVKTKIENANCYIYRVNSFCTDTMRRFWCWDLFIFEMRKLLGI